MLTKIINGNVLTPSGWVKDCSVFVQDGKIVEITNANLEVVGAEIFDAKGSYVVPGGIETHVHGGGGRDFMEGSEDAFRTAIAAHMQYGTTAIYPTLSSSTIPMIRAAAASSLVNVAVRSCLYKSFVAGVVIVSSFLTEESVSTVSYQ